MSGRTDNLTSLLIPYGLTEEEAKIYLIILENGVMTALAISRNLNIGRTKVYRILDKLLAKGLVVNQFDEIGFKFRAEPPDKLRLLVNLRQAEVDTLKENLPGLTEALIRQMGVNTRASKVLYYQGSKGVAQVNFNMCRAVGELLSFEMETANAFMKPAEAEEMRRELVANKITTRTITNATRLEPFTKVTELVRDFWEIKHIPSTRFEIRAEIFVYNEVYCLYRYTDNVVFAVEIYNEDLAHMQKQIFWLLWEEAMEMKKIGVEGEAQL